MKLFEKTFKDGKLDGLSTGWYENGQKWWEATYKDGKEDGKWTTWYENGQKRWEGTYKDGELISAECWNEDGNEMDCLPEEKYRRFYYGKSFGFW